MCRSIFNGSKGNDHIHWGDHVAILLLLYIQNPNSVVVWTPRADLQDIITYIRYDYQAQQASFGNFTTNGTKTIDIYWSLIHLFFPHVPTNFCGWGHHLGLKNWELRWFPARFWGFPGAARNALAQYAPRSRKAMPLGNPPSHGVKTKSWSVGWCHWLPLLLETCVAICSYTVYNDNIWYNNNII